MNGVFSGAHRASEYISYRVRFRSRSENRGGIISMHPAIKFSAHASRDASALRTTDQNVVQASRYASLRIRCGFTSRSTA